MRRFENWTVHQWPTLLLHAGWVLFGMACLNSARLPVEALLVGPGMMVAAVAMIEWDKREARGQPDGGAGDNASGLNANQ
jgi:hypothetical protein